MQRIVIDTNVIISSLIQRGYPYLILNNLFLEQKIKLCTSSEVMKEYYEVVSRPKFSKFHDFLIRAELLLSQIETLSDKFSPKHRVEVISDEDDNRFLELATESKADFIITGNVNDFSFPIYNKTGIVTPKEYWENHKPS